MVSNSNTIYHVSGAVTANIATTGGSVHTINISVPFTTLDIYDATAGTTLPIFSATTNLGSFIIDGRFVNGLRVVSVGASGKATITYNA